MSITKGLVTTVKRKNLIFQTRTLLQLICTILLSNIIALAALAEPDSAKELKVGYVIGGVYEQYAIQKISTLNLPSVKVKLIPTEGSREQIELLKKGSIDLALVQSDIAYYAYEGKRDYKQYSDFSLVLPLFNEYLQVLVREDSEVFTLGKLLRGVVSAGPKGSGTYQNAMDLFSELGFRPGVDFEQKHLPHQVGLQNLINGDIDGLFYTGGAFLRKENPEQINFRALDIPSDILEAMAIRSTYYTRTTVLPTPLANKQPVNTVAVTALLVASNEVPSNEVEAIVEGLAVHRDLLLSGGQELKLRTPESVIEQSPIPLNDGLKAYLRKQGHMGQDFSLGLIFLTFCFLIGFIVTVQLRMRAYDRMGNLTASHGTITHKLYQLIAKAGTGLIVSSVFVLLVVVFVEAIQYFEDEYARRLNVKNPFADKGFQNSFLWVVTFMGAGDPGETFPNSPVGKLLASALPFLGLGAVFGFGYSALEQRREKINKSREGTLTRSIRDHVLICGWNEKAPGIIYTLTSSDVPRKRHIVVIAEMDGLAPLDSYGFDPRYVSYCKGDSADHKTLERANASYADVAVLLGGVKKREGKNVKSVLSALALKELADSNLDRKKDLMIVAELMFSENAALFEACGANHIVSSEIITDRVAAMCCMCPYTVDFMLDLLTHDDRSELYAVPLSEVAEYLDSPQDTSSDQKKNIYSLKSVAEQLWLKGVNVVAANNTIFKDHAFLDHTFTGEKFTMILDSDGVDLQDEHELLVIADDFKEIKKAVKGKSEVNLESENLKTRFELPSPQKKQIILVGDLSRCLRVAKELEGFCTAKVTIFTHSSSGLTQENIIVGHFTDEKKWLEAGIAEADQITILSRSHRELHSMVNADLMELDAEALLASKFARLYSSKLSIKRDEGRLVEIAAEMISPSNQKLFENAGVDFVIPSSRIIERVITKLIYSRGAATRFLMALLRFDDQKHLMTFELQDQESQLSFNDLSKIMPDYFQLIGVLPAQENGREQWRNNVGDFGYHFLTTLTQLNSSEYRATKGDVLVGIVDQSRWFFEDEKPKAI